MRSLKLVSKKAKDRLSFLYTLSQISIILELPVKMKSGNFTEISPDLKAKVISVLYSHSYMNVQKQCI